MRNKRHSTARGAAILAGAALALAFGGATAAAPYEAPAVEARLIGQCGGRIMAAVEESAFPAGCDWIEPIRTYDAEAEESGWPSFKELRPAVILERRLMESR